MPVVSYLRSGEVPAPALPPAPMTADELQPKIGAESVGRAEEVLNAANAMVDQYAPRAPAALRREAIIRFAGYLVESDFGGIEREEIGPRAVAYPTNHASMFRNSGAAALLSRWRVRRAGTIG